jgi:preprotein translocase subunit YajC
MSLLDILIPTAAAQAAPAGGPPDPTFQIVAFGGVIVVMFFLMIWPQMKRNKEHRELMSRLAKGDEVLTTSGIAGRITDIGDDFITIEIAEKVAVKVQRGAVGAVLPKGTLKSS